MITSSENLTENNWSAACYSLEQRGEAYCLATLISRSGSAPANIGAKMVITQTHQSGTLGGGNLEHQVTTMARKALTEETPHIDIHPFSLSGKSAQHCGGSVKIMFEYRNVHLPKVVIFGAGHVCQALCSILKNLPCNTMVVDTRQHWLDQLPTQQIQTSLQSDPVALLPSLPDKAYILIMTQSHDLDFEVVHHALEHQRFSYVGMIGSLSKKKVVERKLKEQLSDPRLSERLTCPIGKADIPGKLPMEIAVSVAAELLHLFSKSKENSSHV
ncbi:xanthine dehydrogenase accessory protein XdhC [Vibrio albus]|uniref:Xanthine dehydrogenase accessory protein XdhC n=1 Tax=Vibrio albus TaxID=2200953 RepID=A0A2U3B6F0_9VIBR|nr:xanthine dehydrogenase accessory protein XdhC [Vibrio albus]PWI32304.1 xanthine dehydrogenase accessory protein XdhC [Vibrio albus]